VRLWSMSAGEESSVSMFTLKYAQAHYARKNHTQTHTHTVFYVPRVVRPGALREEESHSNPHSHWFCTVG